MVSRARRPGVRAGGTKASRILAAVDKSIHSSAGHPSA